MSEFLYEGNDFLDHDMASAESPETPSLSLPYVYDAPGIGPGRQKPYDDDGSSSYRRPGAIRWSGSMELPQEPAMSGLEAKTGVTAKPPDENLEQVEFQPEIEGTKEVSPISETDWPTINGLLTSYAELIPHASQWSISPDEQPIGWFEQRYLGQENPAPTRAELRLNFEQRQIIISRTLPHHPEDDSELMRLCAIEPSSEQGTDYTVTNIRVPSRGDRLTVSQGKYQGESPGKEVESVDFPAHIPDEELSPESREQRSELVHHMQRLLSEAVAILPEHQRNFVQQHSINSGPSSFLLSERAAIMGHLRGR